MKANPSPSNDSYFNNPKNIESINKGKEDIKAGRTTPWCEVQKEFVITEQDHSHFLPKGGI